MGFSYDDCSRMPGPLEPYGDITGIGVVLAFVISAWLAVLILIAYYIFSFDPQEDPFAKRGHQPGAFYNANPLDSLLFRYTRRLRSRQISRHASVKNGFYKCILSLADAQLITGISILMSAYWSLKHGQGLSAYHWETAVYLAWFSSVTHLSALTFLRTYLAKHPKGRLCRLIFMFILLVLLLVGIIPTGHFEFLGRNIRNSHFIDLGQNMYPKDCDNFETNGFQYYPELHQTGKPFPEDVFINDLSVMNPQNCSISGTPIFQLDKSAHYLLESQLVRTTLVIRRYAWEPDAEIAILPESPAACFFRGNMNSSSKAYLSMISSVVILVYGYLIRAAKIFEGSSKLISQRMQHYLDHAFQLSIQKWERLLYRANSRTVILIGMVLLPLQTSIFCTFRMIIHLYTSMCAETISVLISVIWGSIKIEKLRSSNLSDNFEENDWTFGQVIAILLLSTSLLPIFELIYGYLFSRQLKTEDLPQRQHTITHAGISSCGSHIAVQHVTAIPDNRIPSQPVSRYVNFDTPNTSNYSNTSQTCSLCTNFGVVTHTIPMHHTQDNQIQQFSDSTHCAHCNLTGNDIHNECIKSQIAFCVLKSSTAYEEFWTKSLLVIISGPLILASIIIFSDGTGGENEDGSELPPTGRYVAVAKLIASVPAFVQSYTYLRFHLEYLPNHKGRKILLFILLGIIEVSSIWIGIEWMSTSFGFLKSAMAKCLLATIVLQLAVALFEFWWLLRKWHDHDLQVSGVLFS